MPKAAAASPSARVTPAGDGQVGGMDLTDPAQAAAIKRVAARMKPRKDDEDEEAASGMGSFFFLLVHYAYIIYAAS